MRAQRLFDLVAGLRVAVREAARTLRNVGAAGLGVPEASGSRDAFKANLGRSPARWRWTQYVRFAFFLWIERELIGIVSWGVVSVQI